jgi:putative ABC transport system substrate-binding protein
MTGLLTAKRLEQLHEMVPNAAVIGYLANSDNPNFATHSSDVHEAARVLGLALHAQSISTGTSRAFLTPLYNEGSARFSSALIRFFFARRGQIIALAARYSLPASYSSREFVAAGGLISYAASFVDGYRLAGIYSGRILHGEKPADLPVVQSVKFELAITSRRRRRSASLCRTSCSLPPTR